MIIVSEGVKGGDTGGFYFGWVNKWRLYNYKTLTEIARWRLRMLDEQEEEEKLVEE